MRDARAANLTALRVGPRANVASRVHRVFRREGGGYLPASFGCAILARTCFTLYREAVGTHLPNCLRSFAIPAKRGGGPFPGFDGAIGSALNWTETGRPCPLTVAANTPAEPLP